jgi:hypothetical protein
MPPAAEPPTGSLCGLLLDIGGVVHSTAMHLVGRLAETEPAMRPVLERAGMTAVRVPWEDPGPAIDTARTLLRLPPRQSGDNN